MGRTELGPGTLFWELHRRIPGYRIAGGAERHLAPGIRRVDHLRFVGDEPSRGAFQ